MATANGAVSFEAGGKRHSLRYGMNALCALEDRLGTDVSQLGTIMASGMNMRTLRTVFACGLGDKVTDAQAGDLMDELGVTRAGELVAEAMQAAFPAAEGDASDPQAAAAGTGSTS